MKAEEMRAEYAAAQRHGVEAVPFSDVTVPKIEQGGPLAAGEFTYVDISSVDNKLKRITEYKTIAVEAAPSRAKQRLKSGDVLVSMTRPNLNAVAIVPPELDGAVGSTGFHVLRATEGTEPRWLYYGVQTKDFISAMYELVQGALYPAVRPKDIRAYEIPHPPIDQQKRIVAEIEKQFSRLDEAVANLKRVKANLKRYKAAVLKAAVEGRLVETEAEIARREGRSFETGAQLLQRILETRRSQWQGKGKYKEPAAPDTTGLPELPGGWVWASADQVMALITDGEHITPQRSGSGVLLLSARNVLNGRLDLTEVDFIPDDEHERLCKRLTIAEGDVLLSCSGSVGRTCVVPPAVKFSLVRSVAVLRPALISSEFVCYQIQSPWLQSQIKSKQTQTAQANIFQGKIRQLTFALPPEAEQDRIVAEVDRRLSLLREIEAQVDVNLRRAERLRPSILQQAFAGGLMGMSREKLCA